MFTAGLAVFTAASVLCGVTDGQGVPVAARAVQRVGGAMTAAVVLGMLVALFPEPLSLNSPSSNGYTPSEISGRKLS
jgi:hypothetical protein